MKNLFYVFALALTFLFTACGDDDSSSFVEPEKESSDSGATLSGDSHEGSSPSSCSSKDDKSSSSVSSSSAKSSSSTDTKSSSSLKTCPPEKEGKTRTIVDSGEKQICQNGYWVPMESSSSVDVSSSSYFDMTNQFNEKVSYGEFTDPRDGQKYRTVDMYDDVFEVTYTIFAENLNYGEKILGGTVQGDSTKYCYDDDTWYCDNGWGGLYTWSNAMGFPAVCDCVSISAEACSQKFVYPSGHIEPADYVQHQGACPEGWHIMNGGEWAFLSEMSRRDVSLYMGSKIAGFGNDNLYGISLLPAGYWNPAALEYGHISNSALYWLPRQYPEYDDCAYRVAVRTNEFNKTFRGLKTQGFSVRCVKDY
ncbi:FISUMP domain-containing protein [Fibrobacter sp. UBA4309]|uniref:FISUMP domain-containing protein n=1 Tax=Fibrobacter sp. UBA4309 TaxID=1946537 RepID=UPI0025BE3E38|nr:FISUMP domain-containing protein [Fibrobacter sp. UBA4309]